MITYSDKEIIDDIFTFEGVQVRLELEDKRVNKFFKLYSEVYDVRLGDNSRVEDLKDRINRYIDKYSLPNLDVLPDTDYEATIYYKDGDIYKKEASVNTVEESKQYSDRIKEKSSVMFIYVTEENRFMYFDKNTH